MNHESPVRRPLPYKTNSELWQAVCAETFVLCEEGKPPQPLAALAVTPHYVMVSTGTVGLNVLPDGSVVGRPNLWLAPDPDGNEERLRRHRDLHGTVHPDLVKARNRVLRQAQLNPALLQTPEQEETFKTREEVEFNKVFGDRIEYWARNGSDGRYGQALKEGWMARAESGRKTDKLREEVAEKLRAALGLSEADEVVLMLNASVRIARLESESVVKAVKDQLFRRLYSSQWQPPGPVTSDHPLECLVVLTSLRQSDGDWYVDGSKFLPEDSPLAWAPDTPEARKALGLPDGVEQEAAEPSGGEPREPA